LRYYRCLYEVLEDSPGHWAEWSSKMLSKTEVEEEEEDKTLRVKR
jgi:hypothetical protein